MSQKLENAKNLYMFGIRDGQYKEALDKYTGDKYIQHSTGVADGKEGLLIFLLLSQNAILSVILRLSEVLKTVLMCFFMSIKT